jgi:integrase
MNRKTPKHLAALAYDEVPTFLDELRAQPGTAARALEFLILNASRTGEVIGAKPAEVDLRKGLWTVPAERMKAKKEHRVPLAPRAMEIAEAQDLAGDYLFPGGKEGEPLSDSANTQDQEILGRLLALNQQRFARS